MINKILESLKITEVVDLTKIPQSSNVLNIAGLEVPLYGELLGIEQLFFTTINNAIKPYQVKLDQLKTVLDLNSLDLDSLIPQLQIGKIISNVYSEIPVDYDKLGYKELRELADKAGVEVFSNIYPTIDGEPSMGLVNVAQAYYEKWINNNLVDLNPTLVDICNHILLKKPVRQITDVTLKEVDAEKLLKELELSWDDLYLLESLNKDEFIANLLIFVRTGVGAFSVLNYVTITEKDEYIRLLKLEVYPEEEVVLANDNVQTTTQEATEEDTVLK